MNPTAQTLVCFALKEEAGAFRKLAVGRKNVSILLTGIGRKNAEKAAREFLGHHSPKRVFTSGFAGGLNPEWASGVVVFSTDDVPLGEKLTGAGATPAKFLSVPRIVTTEADKAELRRSTGADVVEMESEVIHAICRERRISCATVRVISDAAHEDLPLDFNRVSNADLSLNYGKLALALAKSPGTIPALLRLQRNSRLAAERLAAVLTKVIA